MTLATEVKKLTESKPFYAVAGAGDYVVEKLRELPEQFQKLREADLAKELPERTRAYATKAENLVRDLPVKAREYADQLGHRAAEVYEASVSRGRKVVSKVSGEAALELEEAAVEMEKVSTAAEPPKAAPARKTRTTTATKA
ncbi:hypothetical protein [Thermoactinospora rubra]|uniref:hypothetical protein n=1 Tax=Thermoactinospora rubra TaxID=1088767 RepID=UPI000A0F6BFB|nr:hypothetical protein [Thermoactinospora rubra]